MIIGVRADDVLVGDEVSMDGSPEFRRVVLVTRIPAEDAVILEFQDQPELLAAGTRVIVTRKSC